MLDICMLLADVRAKVFRIKANWVGVDVVIKNECTNKCQRPWVTGDVVFAFFTAAPGLIPE